jgi:hypothetical protein
MTDDWKRDTLPCELGTDEEKEDLCNSDIEMKNQQGKNYLGQVQTDCFCQIYNVYQDSSLIKKLVEHDIQD